MITILPWTTKDPLNQIGYMAGICWNSKVDNKEKNICRAINCIESGHTRTAEFPEVYCIIEGYSARCLRELYTHIVGTTRLQESTRYVNCENFETYIPRSVSENTSNTELYVDTVRTIKEAYKKLVDNGIPKEDAANILPIGMDSKMVWKINLRALMHFMNMRLCGRALKEIRDLSNELKTKISEYSEEWKTISDNYLVPKCVANGKCTEEHPCGERK